MAYREKAVLVLSGQILKCPYEPLPALSLHKAIARALKDRDVVLTRRVVTLTPKHAKAAPLFLNAGFEILPADDEDLQAAATISSIVAENPIDEVVFMFGASKPIQFLRSLAGKVNRTLLAFEPLDDELALNLEGAYDFRELLSKEGVNCDVLSTQNGGAGGKSSSFVPKSKTERQSHAVPAETSGDESDVNVLCQTTPFSPEDFFRENQEEWLAEVEKYLRLHGGHASALDVVQELDGVFPGFEDVFLKKPSVITNPLSNDSCPNRSKKVDYKKTGVGAFFYLSELKDLSFLTEAKPDLSETVVSLKEEWLPELERIVLSHGGKCNSLDVVEILEEKFPGFRFFFTQSRNTLYKILRKTNIRLVEEYAAAWFYHASHPEMQPVTPNDSNAELVVGSDAYETPEITIPQIKESPSAAQLAAQLVGKLEKLVEASGVLWEFTSLYAERASLNMMGFNDSNEIKNREDELVSRASAANLYLWPLKYRSQPNPTREDYEKASYCYELFVKAFGLLKQYAQMKEAHDLSVDVDAIQTAADLQCLLKTALLEAGIDPGVDPVQHRAFELLGQYRDLYGQGKWINNMRWENKLNTSLDVIDSYRKKLEQLTKSYREAIESYQNASRQEQENSDLHAKLAELCEQIKNVQETEFDPVALAKIWTEVVSIVTTLCRDFKVPFSSLKLREILYDVVDKTPDDVETTDEFVGVRQELDLERERNESQSQDVAARPSEEDTLETRRVRSFFQGKKVVFVGGEPKEHIKERLINRLGFSEVVWEAFDHGDSLDRFQGALQDQDVKLFLVYIPWCSHKHSRELMKKVKRYGKTLIRVTHGTSAVNIADAICEQTSVPQLELDSNPELLQDDE